MYAWVRGGPSFDPDFLSVVGLPLLLLLGLGCAISGSDVDDSEPEPTTCRFEDGFLEAVLPGESSISLLAALTLG